MANRYYKQFQGTLEAGIVKLYGSFVTSTSGTVASSSAKGFSVAKTGSETGRYTITLEDTYYEVKQINVTIVGAADAAYTATKGLCHFVRNISVNDSTPTLQIQFADPATSADAELESAASVYIELVLKNSSIPY